MDRRFFLLASGMFPLLLQSASGEPLDSSDFQSLIKEAQTDPGMIERSWAYRDRSVSRGVGTGEPSKRKLSQRAIDLIIAFEISSPKAYERKYRRPIWPRGESGVTIGVGYDLKFSNKKFVDRDWYMLNSDMRSELYSVIGIGGQEAKRALEKVPSVDISWADAERQFMAFIQFPAKQTEKVFTNCDMLPDDCFGALVSLIYNRGPKVSQNGRRKEMYQIQEMMKVQDFSAIPGRLRAMKRIWEDDPDAVGLLRRRDAEAALFEIGLSKQ
jgi:GH24 family phage-related lysozyme (muramidase)